MAEEITYRKFTKNDLEKISEFRKKFFPVNESIKSRGPRYYEWKCLQNPVMPGEMWLAEDGDTLVSMTSMVPKRLKILGRIVEGAETGDTYTRPDYQRRGIFTGLFQAAREQGLDSRLAFIYGLPNDESLPGYVKKLNYAQVSVKLHHLVKVLDYKKTFDRGLASLFLTFIASPLYKPIKIIDYKRILSGRLVSRPFKSIVITVLEASSRLQFRTRMKGIAGSDITVSTESSFPDDIDGLWKQVAGNYDVALVRSKEYLSWRYVSNPDTYSIFIARNKAGDILGYMVTKTGQVEGAAVGYLVDFMTLENNPDIFKNLLAGALEQFRRKNTVLISTFAVEDGYYYKILSRLGFFNEYIQPVICYNNELGSQVLNMAYKWHFTMGDSDGV